MRRAPLLASLGALAALATAAAGLAALGGGGVFAPSGQPDDVAEARRQLAEAQQQGNAARLRAEGLERAAAAAGAAARNSAAEAAAIAARIQQAEAEVQAGQARIALIDRQRADLRDHIAARQQPLVRLTAALQRLSQRPLLFSLFRPGSVKDTMHLSAVLATLLPEVERRTAGLRSELGAARGLRRQAEEGIATLRSEQADLARRPGALAALETRQRLAARDSAGVADREAERALALAEQARDLGALADDLGRAGRLRDELALLPGPIMRPARPGDQSAPDAGPVAAATATRAPVFLFPAQGRLVAGFGEESSGSVRSRGVTIAASAGAQVIAPAAGRVAFAGLYRGFGQIVIVDHGGGWTSLVTGLGQVGARVGDLVVAGSPLGTAGPGRPLVTFEIRRDGTPVNPLELIGARR